MSGTLSPDVAALAHVVRAITDKQDSAVSPGVLGFIVVALLGVATWLLIRSMNRQFRKIDLPEGGAPIGPAAARPADQIPAAEPDAPTPASEPDA